MLYFIFQCVAALVLAVAVLSVNGYHYYPGYVGGLDGRIVAAYPPTHLVDGKSVETKIEGVAGISYLNYPRSYYGLPYNYGYSYGWPTYGPALRIARDLGDLKKVES